jgi:outer membrane protein OmpA-like peptidoglycan-associated protein
LLKSHFNELVQPVVLMCVIALFLNACARQQREILNSSEYSNEKSLTLNEACTALGINLKIQLENSIPLKSGQTESIVIDPILSTNSGQQFKGNQQVIEILSNEIGTKFKFDELTPGSLNKARYVLAGALTQNKNLYDQSKTVSDLVMTIFEWPTGTVRAKGQVRVSNFLFEPLLLYDDSPIFLLDKSSRFANSLVNLVIGQLVSSDYLKFLPIKAYIQKGISSYEENRHADSANFFLEAIANPIGRTLTAYAGLYLAAEKLHKDDVANQAFANLLSVAIEENRRLDIKLLFSVNSPVFIPNDELVKRYSWWLKHIAVHMQKSDVCLNISGHCSKSGNSSYNERLSLSRARTVQGVMAVTYPGIKKRSHVEGRGYRENIVGTGADNASDAVDRRVEFSIIDCSALPRLKVK